ncbi:Zinc finger BED domain-containing protein 4 [Eumeta japonica]|uniref:Zinc finger BED domain-containing protein 4 n=1 Tax=Eumeta variegata TaxID=151549 RepID=A0A4C1SAK2_EUMVA|nr:Zinc finger BED domain-containing protein 4 [Eumeta japonica]
MVFDNLFVTEVDGSTRGQSTTCDVVSLTKAALAKEAAQHRRATAASALTTYFYDQRSAPIKFAASRGANEQVRHQREMVTAAHGHLQLQRSHLCVAGVLGRNGICKSVTPLQEAKKQLSLEEVIQKANKWDVNNVNSKKIDKLIGEMIPLQNLPFNFVEGLGFRRLIQEIAPRYNFRGRNFFTEFVCKELYGKIAIKVKELLKKFDHMSFTSDIWSDPSSNASLLSLTCHGIASDFERSSIILKCETFDDRHTGDIIAEKFDTMLSEWNISNDQVHCMIRDGGSNMKRAMRLAKLQDLDCAVHKMQLAIQSSLNSQENIKVTETFEEATRELSSSHTHLISDSDNSDADAKVSNYLTASPESPIYHAAKTLKAGISGKFSTLLEEENSYIIATYLDPRYKNKFFTSLTEEKIKDDILKISRNTEDILASRTISPSTERAKKMRMTDSMDTDSERPGTSGTGRQSCLISDLAMILDSSSDDESQKTPEINNPDVILKKELLTFRNKKRINLNECPLKWWSVNQSEYKLLSKMARKFLSAPPASDPNPHPHPHPHPRM